MIPKKEWDSLKRSHKHKETAFVSAYINSPCYHFITRFLIDKNITPNQVVNVKEFSQCRGKVISQ